jgi:predicted DNA-binding protein
MSKKEIDRHIEPKQVSFTFLVEEAYLVEAAKLAKKQDRTKGSIVREALRIYIESRRVRSWIL